MDKGDSKGETEKYLSMRNTDFDKNYEWPRKILEAKKVFPDALTVARQQWAGDTSDERHPEDGRRYIAILQKFLYSNWCRVFTEESPGKNSPSSKSVGGKLELEMDSSVIATITAQEDGWVTIQFSDQPGRSTRTRIDHFLSNYRRYVFRIMPCYRIASLLSYERYSFLSCAREQMFGIIELTAKCGKLPTDCRQLKIKAVDYQ